MCESPIFLTGVYRSGTTLPAQILNNHSQLRITYDTLQFFRFYLGRFDPIKNRYTEIVNDAAWRLDKRYLIKVPKKLILSRLDEMTEVKYKDVYTAIMVETFCAGNRDLRWGEKSVLEWTNIPTFLTMYPEGKALHIIRDPRDVLASYREVTIEPRYRYLDAVFACLHSMNWAATTGAALPNDSYLVLKHEDFVTKPEQTTRQICRFLDIEFEPDMLDTSQFRNYEGKRWEGNSAFGDVSNQISSRSINRWHSKLQDFELIFVESIIGEDLLKHFGYQASGIKVNAANLQKLWEYVQATPLLQNRLQHWLSTGEGVESYPSDPTDPANWDWSESSDSKGTKIDKKSE